MNANFVRFAANGTITVVCLFLVAGRLTAFPTSAYHLLWGGVVIIVALLDIYFLTKSTLNKPKSVDTSVSSFIFAVGGSLGFVGSAVAIGYPVPDLPFTTALRQAGSIVALLPYPFIIWSLLCLKECLTVIPEAHGVVAHGIYKYSRHPLYMCYVIWAIANIMMFPSLPMLAASSSHIALLVLRIRREEKLLLATFPEYRDYYSRTGLIGNLRLRALVGG
jgi:protein-S-isoprenylcysteine O-methyltransferase Ste14